MMGIRGLILILLAWAIYHQVFQRKDLGAIVAGFQRHFSWDRSGWIAAALVLMPVNWGLEALKWQYLLRPALRIPFSRAVAGILAGISVSLFTPNRIGEYGGRLLTIPAAKSWLGLSATFVGSAAQWVALILGGCWGLFVVGHDLWPPAADYRLQYAWLLWGGALLTPVLYVQLGQLADWIRRHERLNKSKWYRAVQLRSGLQSYTRSKLFHVLILGCSRYVIYSSQYLLLLYGFGFTLDPLQALAGIALVFFVQSSVPLPPFMALVARSELALLLWTEYGVNELVVLAATFALFIINLIVPALLGGATIVKIKQ